jgi:serine/threonine protein kinase
VLRELKLMRHLGAHDNLVQLVDLIEPPSLAGFADVYIVSNLFETDLHRVLCSKQVLSSQHVQYFIYQLLRGLKVLHDARVIHRDLKPSNLLVNSNCDLAICDYGLARGMPPENDPRAAGSSSSGGGSGGGGASGSPSPPPVALTEYVVSTLVGVPVRRGRERRRTRSTGCGVVCPLPTCCPSPPRATPRAALPPQAPRRTLGG